MLWKSTDYEGFCNRRVSNEKAERFGSDACTHKDSLDI